MLKIILYLDLYPGQDMKYAMAVANPTAKLDSFTRYRLTVELPDPARPDADAEVLVEELGDDEES